MLIIRPPSFRINCISLFSTVRLTEEHRPVKGRRVLRFLSFHKEHRGHGRFFFASRVVPLSCSTSRSTVKPFFFRMTCETIPGHLQLSCFVERTWRMGIYSNEKCTKGYFSSASRITSNMPCEYSSNWLDREDNPWITMLRSDSRSPQKSLR